MTVEQEEPKELKDMTSAEIIEAMINTAIRKHASLEALDGQGSLWSSEEKLIDGIVARYDNAMSPLIKELEKREIPGSHPKKRKE